MDVYAKSPYYKGVALLNNLSIEIQNLDDVNNFNNSVKRHFGIE